MTRRHGGRFPMDERGLKKKNLNSYFLKANTYAQSFDYMTCVHTILGQSVFRE
jgi:hypothetical protein